LVRDLAAEGIPVRLTCGVLGHSTQAYYAWLSAPVSRRNLADAYLTNALIDAHADDPEFGYRFLADEVTGAGLVAGVPAAEAVVDDGAQGPARRGQEPWPGGA
jgi:putative transposase